MKCFLLLLLALPISLLAQVRTYNGEKFVEFTMQFPEDSTSLTGVDWAREKLEATFTLKGKSPLAYRVKPLNDTIIELWQLKNNKWQLQENIEYFGWALHRWDEGNKIISELKITDFDHDGDEDLVCWVNSNINGNEWTIIFINDEKQQKLVKLVNTAALYNSDIWDAPVYDPATGIISTELFSGAYGIQNTATYRLQGTTALPLVKEEDDMGNPDYLVHTTYKGENGKWLQTGQTKEVFEDEGEPNGYVALEKEGYVMFQFEPVFTENGGLDFKSQEISTDITLNGSKPLYYKIVMQDEATAILMQKANNDWVVQETFLCDTSGWEVREGWPMVSSFKIEDFNKDGNYDLMYVEMGGGHNTLTVTYFINDSKQGKLVKLYDSAQETDFFVNPEYDAGKKTLTTYISGGMYYSATATYKIKNSKAEPLSKTEYTHTDDGQTTETVYKGKKGKWKLQKTLKISE
jgi:hypothetical protein